jgi:hypothetical protein
MHIYSQEKLDGLEEALSAKASISYAALAEKKPDNIAIDQLNFKALAGINDNDLYYTQSILVTTSWNKNDDIFDKYEVWSAKSTPTHKPTNLEHNEQIIVGHITSNYPVTEDGVMIDENTPQDNLPDKFHILTGSVIYTGYTDPELKERANLLISEIENGSKYVSMECFFKGFDYGLIDKNTGSYQVLPRNEETAFLTKHLRAYGGLGEHQNYKVGRVLRNITFTGKGFVNKPANPESIIFTKDSLQFDKEIAKTEIEKEKKYNFSEIGVFSNQANLKENDMNLEQDIIDLKEKIEAMSTCSEKLEQANQTIASLQETIKASEAEAKSKDAMTEEYMNKMKMTEEDKKKMRAEFDETLTQKASEYDDQIKTLSLEIDNLKTELAASTEIIAAYKNKEEEMMKKEKRMKRMAALMDNGLDQETANSTVDKFENLDDESFDSVAALLAVVKTKTVVATEETSEKEEKETKAEDVSEVLDNVETEKELDLSVGSENETETSSTRAALVDFVCTRLGKKLNKGE